MILNVKYIYVSWFIILLFLSKMYYIYIYINLFDKNILKSRLPAGFPFSVQDKDLGAK